MPEPADLANATVGQLLIPVASLDQGTAFTGMSSGSSFSSPRRPR